MRRHALFGVIAVFGLVLRGLVTVAYPSAIMYLGDSAAYLDQARRRMWPGDWRPSGFPMFLRLIDGQAHFTRLVVIQQLLTFAAGLGLYIVALRVARRPWIAALAAAPALLWPWVLDLGQFVLADSLFGTLVTGGVVVLARPGRPTVPACVAGGLLLATAVVIRTVGCGPLVVVGGVLAGAAVRACGRRGGLARSTAFVLAAAMPILGYSTWSVANGGAFSVSAHSGFFLYGRMAPFADCAVLSRADLRTLCDPRPVAERPQPDRYLWPDDSLLRQGNRRIPPGREDLAGEFAGEVLRAQPVMVATTTVGYLIGYFSPVPHENAKTSRAATWEMPDALANILPPEAPHAADGYYVLTRRSQSLGGVLLTYSRLGYAPMPLVGTGLLAGLAAAAIGRRRGRRGQDCSGPGRRGQDCSGPGRLFWLASGAGMSVLVTAALTAGFDYRYLGSVIGLLGAAAVLGWIGLVEVLRPPVAADPQVILKPPQPSALSESGSG